MATARQGPGKAGDPGDRNITRTGLKGPRTPGSPKAEDPGAPGTPWRKPTIRVIATLAAFGLAAASIAGISWLRNWQHERALTCMNSGVTYVMRERPGEQCAGITDGGFAFSPSLAPVSRLIRTENQEVQRQHANWVSIAYTGLANPGEWVSGSGYPVSAGRASLAAFQDSFQAEFPAQSEADGGAMMAFDAMVTATSAIRLAPANPSPADVAAEISALHGLRAVHGTSGLIEFYGNPGPGSSDAVGKAVPVLQIMPDGKPKFRMLTWPDGQPANPLGRSLRRGSPAKSRARKPA